MSKTTMSTVDKALSLLRHFSVQQPEIGLSELARIAMLDKTTVLRCMTALERNGFVEQDADSKKYRLGLAPINLTRVRERSFPLLAVLQPHLDHIAATVNETAHASFMTGNMLMTAQISEPDRATWVHLDPAVALPIHATASGMVLTCYLPQAEQRALASGPLDRFTDTTTTDPDQIAKALIATRQRGYGRMDRAYESDVVGTAVAFFGPNGYPLGTIAVAAVASRFTDALSDQIIKELQTAATAITTALGGRHPDTAPKRRA